MPRRITSLLLVPVLLLALPGSGAAYVNTAEPQQTDAGEKVKERVAQLAAKQVQVKLKLREGKKLVGQISEVGQDSFVVTESETGARTSVGYADVLEIKEKRKVGKWLLIAAAVVVLAVVWIAVAVTGDEEAVFNY